MTLESLTVPNEVEVRMGSRLRQKESMSFRSGSSQNIRRLDVLTVMSRY